MKEELFLIYGRIGRPSFVGTIFLLCEVFWRAILLRSTFYFTIFCRNGIIPLFIHHYKTNSSKQIQEIYKLQQKL